jgi:hypothetical protein
MLDYQGIGRRYLQTRAVSFKLNNTLARQLPRETLQQAAKQLGLWVRGTLVLGDESHLAVLMDFAIHDCHVDGRNGLDRYLKLHPPAPGSDFEALLATMQRGHYSLFQVKSVVPGVGAHVTDLMLDEHHFLADRGLSETASKGTVLATRVFAFEDFLITGGAPLVAERAALERIAKLLSLPENDPQIPQQRQMGADLTAQIIRLCLRAEDAPEMQYQGVPDEPAEEARPALAARPPGRNEPCSCGSGKKYKKCCGK